jgi:Right handed beta helix region
MTGKSSGYGSGIASSSVAIYVTLGADFVIDQAIMYGPQSGTQWAAGIKVVSSPGMWVRNCEISQTGVGIYVVPGASQGVAAFTIHNCFINSTTGSGILIAPTGSSAAVVAASITNCWIGGGAGSGSGIDLAPASGGAIDGVFIGGCQILDWAGYGILINTSVTHTDIVGCAVAECLQGIYAVSGATYFSITSCRLGPGYGYTGNTNWGLVLGGSNSNVMILGNSTQGNTSGGISGTPTTPYVMADNI